MIEKNMFSHAPRGIELINETPETLKRCQGLQIAWDDKIWQAGILFGSVLVNYWAKVGQNRLINRKNMFSHAPRSIEVINETPETVKRCQGLHIALDD